MAKSLIYTGFHAGAGHARLPKGLLCPQVQLAAMAARQVAPALSPSPGLRLDHMLQKLDSDQTVSSNLARPSEFGLEHDRDEASIQTDITSL